MIKCHYLVAFPNKISLMLIKMFSEIVFRIKLFLTPLRIEIGVIFF